MLAVGLKAGHRGLGTLVAATAVVLSAFLVVAAAFPVAAFVGFFAMLRMTLAVVLLTVFVVVPAAASVLREEVVVLGALHGRCGKTVSEFNAPHAGNSKDGMGHLAFHTVPERFSQADGKPFHGAFHHATQGISLLLRGLQGLRPLRGIR